MNELSLFSGAGGGLLATKHLLGWNTIGYVEFDKYCQRVLAARIKDGLLDDAPIFGDIRAFIDQGFAERYRGMAQVVSAGFPCQPFSDAGKREGSADARNMWPATLRCIQEIKPKYVFLENVPGLLSAHAHSCVCGWTDRWRGSHRDSDESWEALLRGSGCWDVGQGEIAANAIESGIWGDGDQTPKGNGSVERGLEMAYWRGQGDSIPEADLAVSHFEARASGDGNRTRIVDGFASDIAQWLETLDEGRTKGGVATEEEAASFELERPQRCRSCGRLVPPDARLIRYLGTIFRDLAESGFDVRWRVLSAAEMGAPHLRRRVWMLARNADCGIQRAQQEVPGGIEVAESGRSSDVADAELARLERLGEPRSTQAGGRKSPNDATAQGWWGAEPDVGRMVARVASRVDRLKSLGNGQVSIVAARAWELLGGEL